MRNICLTLAYDGTDYAGWQVQPDAPTVQQQLEAAIHALSGQQVRVLSAGRTDAGVHAFGQVANFRIESTIPPEKWQPALQSKLPHNIVVRESREVDMEFHATYSAQSKRYRYVIMNRRLDDPFLRRYCWKIDQPLDAGAMHQAAQALLGKHDFRCFESHWPNKATSVRTILDVSVQRLSGWPAWSPQPIAATSAESDGEFIVLEIEADGFLYNMVRAITGTLVEVGRGKWPVDVMRDIVEAGERGKAGPTAPPQGLALVCVNYGGSAGPA
ncbi:tRNA pseudouridine synthase A [Maioricimonas rarisocia]|uniref:tRNA pseudouridine synthase A n=1 Tax=Maioricimonas rarisocia TaxID=2528026 RepID=A0A517Z241_9PLAN|nr:tRNA pseudouridine(38-40) synthase TruA [Maioricimonas rarisocia]QDU36528.1 tRNA pseudouridine synthase A [Maioricimonas rarisocia]